MRPKKFPTPKKQGEWAEQAFILKAMGLDITLSRPIGDSSSYDVVAEGPTSHRLNRVQVKSIVFTRPDGLFAIHTTHRMGLTTVYTASEIDFLALYVIPEDLWYIIPVTAIGEDDRRISVRPSDPEKTPRFEPYREAWHLLF